MSTKTSIKRIALVAAAALTLGGFTAVSAHATNYHTTLAADTGAWNVINAYSGTGSFLSTTSQAAADINNSTAGTQVVGGAATLQFRYNSASNTTINIASSGAGTISYAAGVVSTTGEATAYDDAGNTDTTALGGPFITGTTSSVTTWPTTGFTETTTSAKTQTMNVTLTSALAGTQTIVATVLNASGTPIATYSGTVTWVASAATGVSAANSALWISKTAATCAAAGANHAADLASIAAAASTTTSAAKSGTSIPCFIARDAAGSLIPVTGLFISTLGGSATSASSSATYGNASMAGAVAGNATVTAYLTDAYGNIATLTTSLAVYGSMATLTLSNGTYAALKAGANNTAGGWVNASAASTTTYAAGNSTSSLGIIWMDAKDSNGVAYDATSQTLTSPKVTVVSDANPSVAVTAASGASNSAGATVTFDIAATRAAVYAYTAGTKHNALIVDCAASTKAEKLTITFSATNSAGTVVTSSPVTFYCSTSAKTVTVSPASASVDAGATTTISATVVDAQGYPAPDGTSVTFASTGQGVVAPSSGYTSNGVAGTADTAVANFIAAGDGGSATVTAIAGNYSGSTSISVAGGSGSSSLSLDAANAATDAANNAYDEAQNATQAASDALAAVTALSAQVSALIATVKSLAAMVAKIKAKVKA